MEQLDFLEDSHEDLGAGEGKTCSKCNKFLRLVSYNMASGGNYLRAECRKCNQELTKVRQRLKAEYGMPEGKYWCPICTGDEEDVKGAGNTKNGPWVLDHCHETEKFRGWLCHKCNRALGGFNDDLGTLKRAIDYLSKGQNKHEECV